MGGKGSGGRRKGAGNGAEKVDPDVNHRVIQFTKELTQMDKCDLTDPEAIDERFYDFLALCDKWGMRAGVASYAAALGISRQRLWDLTRRDYQQVTVGGMKLTRESLDIIKKHYGFLEITLENLMMADKGNPVKYFFLAKNHFGYKDQSEHINVNIDERAALPTADEVAAKYAAQLGKPQPEVEVVYELPEGE